MSTRNNLIDILDSFVSQMDLADLRTLLDLVAETGDTKRACAQVIDDIPVIKLARIISTIQGIDL